MSLLLFTGAPSVAPPGPIGPPIVPGNIPSTIILQDAFANPLPSRTKINVLNAADPPGTAPFASQYAGVDSTIATPLVAGAPYRIEYAGFAAPPLPTFFVGDSTVTVIPDLYVSPFANLPGYAQQKGWLIPEGRTSQAALLPGGGVRVLLETWASVFSQVDLFVRTMGAGERLVSSTAGQITSWVADFLGTVLPPFPGETDAAYIARIETWIQQAFTTLPAIQSVVDAFFEEFVSPVSSTLVFDRQSDPTRSAFYGITPGQIAIVLYAEIGSIGSWYLGQQFFLGQTTFLEGKTTDAGFTSSQTSPYPLLQSQVNAIKAAGITPVYVSSLGGL